MQVGEVSTNPQFSFKETIINQYIIAYNLVAEAIVDPDNYQKEKRARNAVIKLAYPLKPKVYILNDIKAKDYIALLFMTPEKFKTFNIHTVFQILQTIVEKLGLTRFEQYKIPKWKSYMEEE